MDRLQLKDFGKIAGPGIPVEVWTPETCGCGKAEPKPIPVPVPEPARKREDEILFLVLAILVLLGDDLVFPVAGGADDGAILPLLARLRQILAN